MAWSSSLFNALVLASSVYAQIPESNPESGYSYETGLGAWYSYAIHQPVNWNTEAGAPPAILYLGGTGNRYAEGETEGFDRVISFGGPGWRIDRYNNGSREEADIMAAEQFLTIIPVYQEMAEDRQWQPEAIYSVLQDARSKFEWDESRLYLAGFSMGARTAWPMLVANPDLFAAASIAAGAPVMDATVREPELNYTGLDLLRDLPILHFAGRQDFENASQVWEHEAIQNHLSNELGFTDVRLQIEEEAAHVDMQQAPWTTDLFGFFLEQTGSVSNETITALPSSSEAPETEQPLESASVEDNTVAAAREDPEQVADARSSASCLLAVSSSAALLIFAGGFVLL